MKVKSKNVKLNSFLKNILKIRTKAINLKKEFYHILYSSSSTITLFGIFHTSIFSFIFNFLITLFSMLYLAPATTLMYCRLIALYSFKCFISYHNFESSLDIHLFSQIIIIMHQCLSSQSYTQLIISQVKPNNLLLNY